MAGSWRQNPPKVEVIAVLLAASVINPWNKLLTERWSLPTSSKQTGLIGSEEHVLTEQVENVEPTVGCACLFILFSSLGNTPLEWWGDASADTSLIHRTQD